jgi:hypothetical protein
MIDPEAFTEARPEHCTHDTYTKSKTGTKSADQESDEQYLICHNEVFGYSITDKRWCAFDLDKVEEIDFSSTAFEGLLLPKEQKDTILSLVRVHTDKSLQFHDLVKGKGKGMIFLLHGVPGVGKTLTAGQLSPRKEDDATRLIRIDREHLRLRPKAVVPDTKWRSRD